MYKIKNSKKSFYKRKTVLLTVILLLVLGGLAFVWHKKQNVARDDSNSAAQEEDYINFNPPTEEEKKETEQNKTALQQDRPQTPESANGKIQVTPIITFADRSEIRAYVPGIFEDGGTCTATATSGSEVKSASSTGFTDVNKTSCAPIKLSLSGSGWSVMVGYSSNSAEGKSAPYEVD